MNVPKLRFKEFTDEWNPINLSKTFNYFSTNSLSREQLADSGIIKNIHYGDIHKKYGCVVDIKKEVSSYIKDLNYNNKYEKCQNNDLIFADASEDYDGIGKAIEIINVNESIVSGLHTILARDSIKSFSPMFKGYYFNSPIIHNQIRVQANGFKVFGISKETINSLNAKIPSKAEQTKIANFLSLLDKKIELQTKKIEDLKLYKLYTTNIIFNSNVILNSEKYELKDILISGSKIPVKDTNLYKKMNIKLNHKGLEINESKREMMDTRPFYIRKEGEIIVGKQNYFNGSIAIVDSNFNNCICSNAIMSFSVKKEYNTYYVYNYISQNSYIKKRAFLANGTGQKELSEKEFLKFTIKVPNKDIQEKTTFIINKFNNKIDLENLKLGELKKLKKGLVQDMFV